MIDKHEEMFNRLQSSTKEAIRLDLLMQVKGCFEAISQDRYETLRSRYKLQSVMKQVLEKKRNALVRPMWGSW